MIDNPILVRAIHESRHSQLVRDVQKARLVNEARANRPSLYNSVLSRVGGMLIAVGQSLEAQNSSNLACQGQQKANAA